MEKIRFTDNYGITGWGFAVCCILVLVSICVVSTAIVTISNIGYCNTQQQLMPNIEFQWVFWGGCLLKAPDGMWVNAEDYLNVDRLRLQLEGDIK